MELPESRWEIGLDRVPIGADIPGMSEKESGIQSVPGTQGTTQAHTPGPWTVERSYHTDIYGKAFAIGYWIAGPEGQSVADASRVCILTLEDARLIAASPDLSIVAQAAFRLMTAEQVATLTPQECDAFERASKATAR